MWVYLCKHKAVSSLILLCCLAEVSFTTGLPMCFAYLVDKVLVGGRGDLLVPVLSAMGGAVVLAAFIGFGRAWLVAKVIVTMAAAIRARLFSHLQKLPPGVLNSTNTWNYKPPAATSIPLVMNVDLFPCQENDDDPLLSSKEVGEPPMTLAATVFFAIKHAVLEARKDQGDAGWFPLECPATVQRVAQACRVKQP